MFENDKKVRKANPDEDLLVVIEEEKTAPRITQVNGEFIYLSIHGFGKHWVWNKNFSIEHSTVTRSLIYEILSFNFDIQNLFLEGDIAIV